MPEYLSKIANVVESPQNFYDDPVWGKLAQAIKPAELENTVPTEYELKPRPEALEVFGCEIVDPEAVKQMELVLRLPISVKGALMPDAHAGYGLPIGGVLAAEGAVIPYGVGLDIGCGMRLTVLDAKPEFITRYATQIERALIEHTHFGMEGGLAIPQEHDILGIGSPRESGLSSLLRMKQSYRQCA